MMTSKLMCYNGHAIATLAHFQPLKCPRCSSLRKHMREQAREDELSAHARREWQADINTLPDYIDD
jgi:hypothetical protein